MCNCSKDEQKNMIVIGSVIENKVIAKDIYKMTIGGEKLGEICRQAKAGQFINIYLKDKSTLLPRPISICQINEESLDIVFKVIGKGTAELSNYKTGEDVKLSNGLGNGYTLDNSKEYNIGLQEKTKKEY